MTEIQQFEHDIASIINQEAEMKNKKAKSLLIKEFPKYNTFEWGDRFRNSQQTAKNKGLIRNNGTKRLVVEHERSSSGAWEIK